MNIFTTDGVQEINEIYTLCGEYRETRNKIGVALLNCYLCIRLERLTTKQRKDKKETQQISSSIQHSMSTSGQDSAWTPYPNCRVRCERHFVVL